MADDEIAGNSCFQLKFYSWGAYIISLHIAGRVILLAGAAGVDGIKEEVELVFVDTGIIAGNGGCQNRCHDQACDASE